MARTYKRIVGKKSRATINKENLEKAIKAITEKRLSLRNAAIKYNVNYTSIHRRMKHAGMEDRVGRKTALTPLIEKSICNRLVTCSDWGYPLNLYEVQKLIGQYLADNNINVPRFTNNVPGTDYLRGFLKRHKDVLNFRLCRNIKRNRAAVNSTTLAKYFEELSTSLHGIPPENIFNYDETNFSDDTGNTKVFCKRKAKYVERIMNSSKTAHSVMFCANAVGRVLPIYVVYKAVNMYDTWMIGGPPHTRYNRSKSGWFDQTCFEDWIKTIIIPEFRKIEGTKILIGDNLSSHISLQVIQLCELYDIRFVFLPSNSSHLVQPLDVAVYGPLKKYWREVLTQWKKEDGMTDKTISKGTFPRLLAKLMNKATPTLSANVVAGFRKCGIYLLSLPEMLSRLPKTEEQNACKQQENVETAMDNTFIGFLQSLQPKEQASSTAKKQQKIKPGKSVSAEDLLQPSIMEELLEPQASKSGTQLQQKKKRARPRKSVSVDDLVEPQEPQPSTSGTQLQQKKKRGRPRKSVSVDDLVEPQEPQPSTSGTQLQQKKKRGIPKKQAQNGPEAFRKSTRVHKPPTYKHVYGLSSSEDEEEPFPASDSSSD